MAVSNNQNFKDKIAKLAIKDETGKIVDYKNPYPEGSDTAKFIDALSFEGKKQLFNDQYAYEQLGWVIPQKGLDYALNNVSSLIFAKPPSYTDPYNLSTRWLRTEGSLGDFLTGVAGMALPVVAPNLGSTIGSALGASGSAGAALGNAIIGGTLAEAQGGDFLKGATSSGIGSLLKTDIAPSVAESVGGGTLGNVVSGAVSGGVTSALKGGDPLLGAVSGGVSGLSNKLSETDASFMAADAAQLAKQGISESQIADTLTSNYASTTAANIAANLASNNTSVKDIENQLTELSKTTGLAPVTTTDSEMIAADALGIAEAAGRDNNFSGLNNELISKGTNIGAVEQNLIASGVDPLVASDIANQIALDPTISVDDLSSYVKDFYGNTIYDVKDLNFDASPPEDTRPEGEYVDANKTTATTPQANQFVGLPAQGMLSTNQPYSQEAAPKSLYSIYTGSSLDNPFARSTQERQSLIAGLFNL